MPALIPPSDVKTMAEAFPVAVKAAGGLDVEAVHAAHGDFVWASLQRLGARDADLEDRFQEVFMVVHQRGGDFEGRSRITTWLFGICLRVMAAHRRRAWVRRERATGSLPEGHADGSPDASLEHAEAQARLREILDVMDLDRRAAGRRRGLRGRGGDRLVGGRARGCLRGGDVRGFLRQRVGAGDPAPGVIDELD